MTRALLLVLGMLLCFEAAAADSAPTPLDFARRDAYGSVKLSPKGTYLAVTVPQDDRTVLAVLNMADRKMASVLKFPENIHVAGFDWVGEDYVVASIAEKDGELAQPSLTGELVALNVASGKSSYMFGYRGKEEVGTHIKGASIEYGSARFIAAPEDDPHYFIAAVRYWDDWEGAQKLVRINLQTGAHSTAGSAPIRGEALFLADRQGHVRYVTVNDVNNHLHTYWRDQAGADWQEETTGDLANARITPVRFAADGKSVYLWSTEGGDTGCLVRRELSGAHARASLGCGYTDVVFSFDGRNEPIALAGGDERPQITTLGDSADATLLLRLQKSFKGDYVVPVTSTRDGSLTVLRVYSDRNPGDYYLYDRATGKAAYMMSRRDWIDPERMGTRRAVHYAARDGHPLTAYLTLPPGVTDPKSLPLVVLPHGGPFGVADDWDWDAEPQMLAVNGYAVLQVNFRGSGGYGVAHREAGKLHWGTTMIDDITDGVRHVIGQDWVDASRVCIYGGSYGGYAALMSAVREPDLYRCAVGYDGAYDLGIQLRESDTASSPSGKNYLREYMADSPQTVHDQSPINFLDRLKAPLLLAHGKQDKRTPYSQYKALTAELDRRHLPYESLVESDEGHGFYLVNHREEFYKRLLDFLGRNLAAATAPAAGK